MGGSLMRLFSAGKGGQRLDGREAVGGSCDEFRVGSYERNPQALSQRQVQAILERMLELHGQVDGLLVVLFNWRQSENALGKHLGPAGAVLADFRLRRLAGAKTAGEGSCDFDANQFGSEEFS